MKSYKIRLATKQYSNMFGCDMDLDQETVDKLLDATTEDDVRELEGDDGLSAGQADCLINEMWNCND